MTYYSHFVGLFLSTSLYLQCFQCLLLTTEKTSKRNNRFSDACTCVYWGTLTLSGFTCTIAYGLTPKADCVVIEVLTFLVSLVSLSFLPHLAIWPAACLWKSFFDTFGAEGPNQRCLTDSVCQAENDDSEVSRLLQETPTLESMPTNGSEENNKNSQKLLTACIMVCQRGNGLLMGVHWIFSILCMVGAITLAMQYRFTNPGTRVEITLPSGQTQMISYNCTLTSSEGPKLPTIWFESSAAHGVVDFLGLQIALQAHGRNSCSYDPPNFGWSDRLSSNLPNFTSSLPALWSTLGVEEDHRILAGWGDGAELALHHAIAFPNTTQGLVVLDAGLPDLEFFDMQRQKNWTESQTLAYRSVTLSNRTQLARSILAIGFPW